MLFWASFKTDKKANSKNLNSEANPAHDHEVRPVQAVHEFLMRQ